MSEAGSRPSGSSTLRCAHSFARWCRHASCNPLKKRLGPPSSSTWGSGVPVEEIIASLFEAVVYQNLATLTKGNTPLPQVLLLGGPNLFFRGLQEAWRHHLAKLWAQRKVE